MGQKKRFMVVVFLFLLLFAASGTLGLLSLNPPKYIAVHTCTEAEWNEKLKNKFYKLKRYNFIYGNNYIRTYA